jgi:prepilin-type N-terminal cleavage/methylation domain-containing protein
MKSSRRKCQSPVAGYSLVEMMMTLAIGLILLSVAMPMMMGAIQGYRLSSIAQQTANLINLTRYAAIRHNMVISLQKSVQNGNTILFVDLNGDGALDPNEPRVMLPQDMQIANGQPSTPDATSTGIANTLDFTSRIMFDYRGTVNFAPGAPTGTYFLALGFVNQAQYGLRAVTVAPMGQTKMWKSVAGSGWSGM